MPNHQRAAAHRTTLARQPGSISGETRLRAADQPIVTTQELPSAVPLMALSTGFWAFKTLAAAHEEGLFSHLAGGAGTTVAELAEALGLHPRPAEMLLTGCAALGLLEKTDGRYRNTPLSEAYLVRGKPYRAPASDHARRQRARGPQVRLACGPRPADWPTGLRPRPTLRHAYAARPMGPLFASCASLRACQRARANPRERPCETNKHRCRDASTDETC